METGQRGATPRDVRDLCDFYGVTDETERDRMMRLAREGKRTAWWQEHDLTFATYVGLEQEAVTIQYYQSTIVPGLMQTRDYARAMHEAGIPTLTPERIDELVEVRATRQQLLLRDPPVRLDVVFDEAVLHRVVGGPRVMGAQLRRLSEMARLDNVTMQIIPFRAGAHPAMDSTFNILDFAGSMPSVVYVEGLVGWVYIDRSHEVLKYQQVFERLRAVALDPEESVNLVARVGKEYPS